MKPYLSPLFLSAKIVYYVITCKNITNILPKMFSFCRVT